MRWLGNDDPTTRRMIETILAREETHAEDMLNILKEMSPLGTEKRAPQAEISAPNGKAVSKD